MTPDDLEENGAPSTPFDDEIPNPSDEIPKFDPPTTEGEQRRGRQKTIRRAFVGVLKSDLPTIPSPGTVAQLDGWRCLVSEDGIEEETFAYRIPLRSP